MSAGSRMTVERWSNVRGAGVVNGGLVSIAPAAASAATPSGSARSPTTRSWPRRQDDGVAGAGAACPLQRG